MATEKRLIDANALCNQMLAIELAKDTSPFIAEFMRIMADMVNAMPTVDAVEVVHGVWEDIYGGKYDNPRFRCSVCKNKALYTSYSNCLGTWVDEQDLSNYCPNCGADMRERRTDE